MKSSLLHFVPLFFLAFTAISVQAEVSVRDDIGQTIRLAQPAKRIVSLAPHITETLFAAGAGAQIVGTVDYSDYPEAATKIRRIGSYARIDLEMIAALKPELIVGWQSGNLADHLSKLRGLGYPLYISEPKHVDDIVAEIKRLGTLAGTSGAANIEAKRVRDQLAVLRDRYSAKPTVRTFYQIWNLPLVTVGQGQIISDAIHLCGGDNVFGMLGDVAPTVSIEAVIAANPEVIIASGMDEARPEWLDDWKKWPRITAVKQDNLFFISPELIQRHTPRLLEGMAQLCKHLERARSRRHQ